MAIAAATVTRLTPAGRGAISSIVVQGPKAAVIIEQCLAPASGREFTKVPLRRISFGQWRCDECSGEELVVCPLANDRVEIHCHGGIAAAEAIILSLEKRGAVRLASETWIHGEEPDIIAAEARTALADAKTERTAMILLDQYHGALRREVEAVIACLQEGQTPAAALKLDQLLQLSSVGRHLTASWRVAIAGPTNVGKSSLMNALLGFSRSIVFDQPGTTRDLVRAETAFDGWPVELIDTAGMRETPDPVEVAGIRQVETLLSTVDLCLLLWDSPGSITETLLVKADLAPAALAVMNKIDLSPEAVSLSWGGPKVSAQTGQGIPALITTIMQRLVATPPSSGMAIPFTQRQILLLADGRTAVQKKQNDRAICHLHEILRFA